MIESIYLAGSSGEVERAKRWAENLKAAGYKVVSTWVEKVLASPDGTNPTEIGRRRMLSKECMNELFVADILWVLVPTSTPGRGAYFEAGYAHAHNIASVFSGPTEQSIFCSLGKEFQTDDEAFQYLFGLRLDPRYI